MRLNPIDEHVGRQITSWRKARGLEQLELAEMAGISPSVLCRYESGKSRAYAVTLCKISKALTIPISYFFDGLPIDAAYTQDEGSEG